MSPSWKKPFRCHVDACQIAVGGTLTQTDDEGQERVIAYFSKKLSDAEADYTANERELLGLVYFLKRFRCYLEGSTFEVITDNQVLKHFFTKPNMSRKEARWLDLLSQFNIDSLTLRPGRIHVLGDSLSRIPHPHQHVKIGNIHILNVSLPSGFEDNYAGDPLFGPVHRALCGAWPSEPEKKTYLERVTKMFSLEGRVLRYQGKTCVPRRNVRELLYLAHDCEVAGHFGNAKTYGRLDCFYWKHKARDVDRYARGCMRCQQSKDGRTKRLTAPSPLEIPSRRWGSVAMDFITHLPRTKRGFDAITTYVDRLSRRVHFVPSRTSDTASDVAKDFFDNIFRLHGLPDSLVSDRDPKFTSRFWRQLLAFCNVKLKMSTSHHPQTDGTSEVMNRMVENYLRCYCSLNQDNWDVLLTSAEFAYNSSKSTDLGVSPFEMDLGWQPRSPLDLLQRAEASVESVNQFRRRLSLSYDDAAFAHGLAKANYAARGSQKYSNPTYSVGDLVWLSREYFTDAVTKQQKSKKLGVRRYGPFKILALIGKNALRLDIPENIRCHPVVQVEHTTPHREQPADIALDIPVRPDPVPDSTGELSFEVEAILAHRKRGRGYQWLALMKGSPQHEAEWQPTRDFIDLDGTLTEAFHSYIVKQNILTHLH